MALTSSNKLYLYNGRTRDWLLHSPIKLRGHVLRFALLSLPANEEILSSKAPRVLFPVHACAESIGGDKNKASAFFHGFLSEAKHEFPAVFIKNKCLFKLVLSKF